MVHAAAGALGRRGPTSPIGTAQSNRHFPTCRFVKGPFGSRLGLLQRADAHLSCTQRCSEREPPSGPWHPITVWDYARQGSWTIALHQTMPTASRAQFQAVIEHLEALGLALSWARRSSGGLTCAVIAADALAMMALVCFLDGPFGVNALDHRTRHATQNWIDAGRSRGEARPLAKLADIGTLLRRATHRSRMLPISKAVAMKVRTFHQRRDLSRSWLGCPAPSPGDVYSRHRRDLAANRGRDAGTARALARSRNA